jgi:hypothetical protein
VTVRPEWPDTRHDECADVRSNFGSASRFHSDRIALLHRVLEWVEADQARGRAPGGTALIRAGAPRDG